MEEAMLGSGVVVVSETERAGARCTCDVAQTSMMDAGAWETWLSDAVTGLQSTNLLRSLRPVTAQCASPPTSHAEDGGPTTSPPPAAPASSVHVRLAPATLAAWLADEPSTGGPADGDLGVSYRPQVSEKSRMRMHFVPSLPTPIPLGCSTRRTCGRKSQPVPVLPQSIGRVIREPVWKLGKSRKP